MKETPEVAALYAGISQIFDTKCPNGKRVGDCKHGVYLFYDYDREPIYVGQTREKLRARIGRHLTNQRTDAVAMSVLDPFEVAEIELWPFWDMPESPEKVNDILRRAEYTVYQRALERSAFKSSSMKPRSQLRISSRCRHQSGHPSLHRRKGNSESIPTCVWRDGPGRLRTWPESSANVR